MASQQAILKRVNRWKLFGVLSLLVCGFFVLITVENLLVSSIFAFVISYTLGPSVNTLERRGTSRLTATALIFISCGLFLILMGAFITPILGDTLSHLQSDMPRLIAGLGQFVSQLETRARSVGGALLNVSLEGRVEETLTGWTHDFFEKVPAFIKTFFTVMLLGPFLAFFMVKDGRTAIRTLMELAPNDIFETALSLQHQINLQVGQFVRARILESLIVALLTTLGLVALGFPYPLLLGVVAGATNLIPYLGPLLGAAPAFLISFVNGYSGLDIVLLASLYILIQLIDAGFLLPLMVARIVNLHPVTVIVVIIAGAQVMGVLGMIISIPLAGTIKVTVSTIYRQLIDTRS